MKGDGAIEGAGMAALLGCDARQRNARFSRAVMMELTDSIDPTFWSDMIARISSSSSLWDSNDVHNAALKEGWL